MFIITDFFGKHKSLTLFLFTLCLPAQAWSQDAKQPIGASFGITTFGASIEGRYKIDEKFALRAFYAGGLSHKGAEEYDDVTFDVDANLSGIGLQLDYQPFRHGWFVSGGLFHSLTEINASTIASPSNPITIDETTYRNGESGSLKVEFKSKIAPMLTTGYRHTFDSGWSVAGELGAIFIGGLEITGESNDIPQADLDAEIAEILTDIGSINAIPFVGVKIGFAF